MCFTPSISMKLYNYLHTVQNDERRQIEMQYAVCANDLEAFRKELESVRLTTMAQRQQVEAENQQLQQRYQQVEEAYIQESALCQRVQRDIPGELGYYTAQLRQRLEHTYTEEQMRSAAGAQEAVRHFFAEYELQARMQEDLQCHRLITLQQQELEAQQQVGHLQQQLRGVRREM